MCVSLGSKSCASRRTTYELGYRAEGREISRETIMKRRAPVLDRDALTAEIAALSKASIKDLRKRWKTLYGNEPSGHVGRSFVIRAIAYRLQEQACGGLKPSTRRLLARVAEEAAVGSSRKNPPIRKAEEQSWSANGKGTRTGSRCSTTACPSTASVTVRSPRSRVRSRAVVGQDRDSSGSERLRWSTTMERSKVSTRRCAIYTRKSSEEGLEQD